MPVLEKTLLLSLCMQYHDVSCLCILVGREESIGRKYKGITMVQWDNHLQNSSFVNHRSKPSFSVISEALYLA